MRQLMDSVFFDQGAFRNDVALFAGARSYREIERLTCGKISLSKAHRIGNGKAELKLNDIEILLPVLCTNHSDYMVKRLF